MSTILESYGTALLAAVLGAVGWLFHRRAWAQSFLARLGTEAWAVVLETEQVFVDVVRKGRADGVLTLQEQREAFKAALASLRTNLGAKGLSRLGRILGLSEDEINGLLGTRIEAAVQTLTLAKAKPAIQLDSKETSP